MTAESVTGIGPGSAEGPLRGYDLDNIRKVYINQSGNLLPCIYIEGIITPGSEKYILRSVGDGQVKVSGLDQIPGYLVDKLVPGSNITFNVSGGPNQTITINSTGSGGGTITGSGIANRLAVWTNSSNLSSSLITDNGTNIGLPANNATNASGATPATSAGAVNTSGGNGGAADTTAGGTASAGGTITNAGGNGGNGANSTNGGANGGNIIEQAGNGGTGGTGTTAGNGGNTTITGGNAGTDNGGGGANGGNVTINGGAATGSGTNGIVNIGTTDTSVINIGNSSSVTNFSGVVTGITTAATAIAGANLTQGQLVAFKNNAGVGNAYPATAVNTTPALQNVVGVVLESITSGATVTIIYGGPAIIPNTLFSGTTPVAANIGQRVYMDMVAGNWNLTAPSSSGDYTVHCGVISNISGSNIIIFVQIGEGVIQ